MIFNLAAAAAGIDPHPYAAVVCVISESVCLRLRKIYTHYGATTGAVFFPMDLLFDSVALVSLYVYTVWRLKEADCLV